MSVMFAALESGLRAVREVLAAETIRPEPVAWI